MHETPIVVIADDLSGAAELAGIAFARGLTTEVQTRFEPASEAQVIAVDTDSRGLSAEAATVRVRTIAEQVVRAQPALIFKKVDSVLRGQPRAEIDAILAATGQQRAILAPANPSRGRVIEKGRYFIDGVALDQTAFANDPNHPRRSAEIADLLGRPIAAIAVPDVASGVDLDRLAQSLDGTMLPAGAADFFAAVLTQRGFPARTSAFSDLPLDSPALLVCGSPAAWKSREGESRAAGLPVIKLAGDDCWLALAVEHLHKHGILVLGTGNTTSLADESNDSFSRFTAAAAELIRQSNPAVVLAEGGATAAALARHLGWSRLTAVAIAPAGVGILRPVTALPSTLVLFKPGSYPWPAAIWDCLKSCLRA